MPLDGNNPTTSCGSSHILLIIGGRPYKNGLKNRGLPELLDDVPAPEKWDQDQYVEITGFRVRKCSGERDRSGESARMRHSYGNSVGETLPTYVVIRSRGPARGPMIARRL
jgi:hypothetical protein